VEVALDLKEAGLKVCRSAHLLSDTDRPVLVATLTQGEMIMIRIE